MSNTHDKAYKMILASKELFYRLLSGFIHEDWVNEIDKDHIEQVNRRYVFNDYREKEADLVYKIRINDRDVVFYVLMELQSKIDFLMPFRLLMYMMLIWMDYFHNTDFRERQRKSFRLPMIVPMVLYNGKGNWTVPLQFHKKIANHELFGDLALNFRYILLDIQRYSDEQLQNVRGIIGQLFFLEKASTPDEFVSRFESILHNREFSIEEWWTLKRFMVGKYEKWIKEIDQKFAQAFDSNDNERDESEMKSNITRMFDKLMDQTLERGIEQGIEQGIERGIEQGIERGKHDEKLEIARKLLRDGFISVEKIAEVTGLTVVEIQSLSE